MSNNNITEKKRITWLFAGFYTSSAILLIMMLTIFWNSGFVSTNSENKKNLHLSGDQQLEQADNFLNDYAVTLQGLDKKYAALMIDSGIKANFDTPAVKIKKTELSLRNAIDSIDKTNLTGNNRTRLTEILSSYKSMLESRQTIDDMQRAVVNMSKQLNGDQKNLMKLQTNAMTKDSTIAALEDIINFRHSDAYSTSSPKSAYLLLQKENNYLKSEIEMLKSKSVINVQLGESDKSSSHSSSAHSQ